MAEDIKDFDRPTTADLAQADDSTSSIAKAEARSDRTADSGPADGVPASLFQEDEARDLRQGWDSIQASFVDEPREAVEKADELVARTMKRLAEMFADERSELEHQWDRGDSVSTEDLRIALQRYRAFFGRLLAV